MSGGEESHRSCLLFGKFSQFPCFHLKPSLFSVGTPGPGAILESLPLFSLGICGRSALFAYRLPFPAPVYGVLRLSSSSWGCGRVLTWHTQRPWVQTPVPQTRVSSCLCPARQSSYHFTFVVFVLTERHTYSLRVMSPFHSVIAGVIGA